MREENNIRERQVFHNILKLPFNENFMKLPRLFRNFNVNLVFTYNNTIKKLLISNSPPSKDAGVYKIPCNCSKYYIGQTGKSLPLRIKQHQYSIRTGQLSNAIFQHLSSCSQGINWENSQLCIKNKSIMERNIIESVAIRHFSNVNFNLSPGLYSFDPFMQKLICKFSIRNFLD